MKNLSVPQIIVLGFFLFIALVTVLLMLPVASATGNTKLVDALFTAVSAVCVTGLTVVNTSSHWSLFGQIVIIIATQIGALGFMTFITMIFIFVGKRITLKERMVIQHSLNQGDLKGMVRLVKNVLIGTLLMEGVAALILSFHFYVVEDISFARSIWYGIFHSVCAFCSAGFDLLGENSMTRYAGDPVVNIVLVLLVFFGSLGYTVWIDCIYVLRENKDKRHVLRKLSLQSRIVLEMTLALTVFGAVFFFVCEYNNPDTLGALPFGTKIITSFFQSVTPRTLGYFTIDQSAMFYNSKLMTLLFMLVGGSPGSTCGGIKTVTVAVIAASVISVIRGRDSIVLHKKRIPFDILQKSLAVVMLYAMIVLVSAMVLTFTETNSPFDFEFFDLLFETVSASSTVGLSMGITPLLSNASKIVLVICMFLGRIGGITVAISLSSHTSAVNTIHYPESKLIVG